LCVHAMVERSENRKEDPFVTTAANTTRSVGGKKKKKRSRRGKVTMTKKRTTKMEMKARTVVANDKR